VSGKLRIDPLHSIGRGPFTPAILGAQACQLDRLVFPAQRIGCPCNGGRPGRQPVLSIATDHGPLLCRGGHGRLLWRARTFHTEEPETVRWLDGIGESDVYWDIGANVGLTRYVAKFRRSRVVAFEPEAQNYALMIENLVLNGIDSDTMLAASIAIGDRVALVRYLTKGEPITCFGRRRRAWRMPPKASRPRQGSIQAAIGN